MIFGNQKKLTTVSFLALSRMERVMGIEPTLPAWKGGMTILCANRKQSRYCVNSTTLDTKNLTNLILTIQQAGSQKEKRAAFFSALFPQTTVPQEASYVICYTLPTKSSMKPKMISRFFTQSQFDAMLRLIESLNGKANIYFSTTLQDAEAALKKNPRSRGTSETAVCLSFLHVDIDVEAPGFHKSEGKNLFPHTEAALIFIWNGIPLTPSIIVNTGGGWHVYWLLDQPMILQTEADRKRAGTLLARFQQWIRSLAGEYKASIDTTADLSRLLRVAFTYNVKTAERRLAEIIKETNRRYSLEEIEAQLPTQELQKKAARRLPFTNRRQRLPNIESIYKNCRFMEHCRSRPNEVSYNEWFAALSIAVHCKNGIEEAHKLSRGYDRYSESETDFKITEALKGKPSTCSYIALTLGSKGCKGCPKLAGLRNGGSAL
jgi:putative DNA primase/helicase